LDPKSVPMQMGRAAGRKINPWENFINELKKAFTEKQVSDEPIAIFIGAFRMMAKAGTKIAPVPMPRRSGRIPANPPIVIFPQVEPRISLSMPSFTLFPVKSLDPSMIIRREMREKTKPVPKSNHLPLWVKYKKIKKTE